MSEEFPYSFGKYRVEAEIGRGGFGTVFSAVDVDLERPVAIKIMDPVYMRDQRWVVRFRREARLMAKLDHPHIVPIHEIGEAQGRLFLTMKLIDGPDLSELINSKGPMSWDDVADMTGQIASALDFAHQNNVIHRDLKPGNILVTDGQALVTDFGLAQMVESNSQSISMSGGVAGTYNYMPPEVFNNEDVSPATDIYALGCMLYEMITGQMLFDGKTTAAIIGAHLKGISLDQPLPAGTPPGTREVLQTAMAKDPQDRYGSANELAQELRRITTDRLTAPYAQLEQAVGGGQWSEALALAADIQTQDPNYRDVAALEQQAQRGQWSEQWRTQAEIALADDDFHAVTGALTQWRRVNPDDPDIQRIERELALAEQYASVQEFVAGEQWAEAQTTAEAIQEQDPSFRDIAALQATIAAGLAASIPQEATTDQPGEEATSDHDDASTANTVLEAAAVAAAAKTITEEPQPEPVSPIAAQMAAPAGGQAAASPMTEQGTKAIPSWAWWVGAIAILAVVIFGIRAIMGGTSTGSGEVSLPADATVALAATEAPAAEEDAPIDEPLAEEEAIPESEGIVEVTRIVTEVEEVIVEVTAAPQEPEAASFVAQDPTTLLEMTFGDIDTLDPSLAYDSVSWGLLQNTMEGLITFNGKDSTTYVPALASEVPRLENGLVSRDGLAYTFKIRDGVTFHDGGELTPSDVAYTFQRGLLQSDPNSPQWLLLEPIMGYASGDISEEIDGGAYYGDREGLIANASPAELVEICETVKERIVADDAAGTVTFNLAQPWAPFLATISGIGYILDKEWVIEQGSWDGDCTTWQNWYAPGSDDSELTAIVNGTGPYKLDHWTPGQEWVLTANEAYWRTDNDPVWVDGPAGQPQIKTIIRTVVDEWDTRFTALQAGDAGSVNVTAADRPLVDPLVGEFCDWETGECVINEQKPDGPLRKWGDLPGVSRSNLFPSFNTGTDSPYIGSGQLDGDGIPPDFFSDIHVRRAIGYCMDFDRLNDEAYNGEGVQNNGPIIQGMLGYNDNGPMYEFDLDQCAAELEQAWNGQLPDTGFRFSILYNTGNVARQKAAQILQESLAAINPRYQVEVVGVPWSTFLDSFRMGQITVATSGWFEDIHDPHNWVVPFTYGTYGGRQQIPDELNAQFQELATAGILTTDLSEREEIYFALQQLFYDEALSIPLFQAAGARYEQRYLDGYTFRVGLSIDNPYYYGMSLKSGE